MPLGPLQTRLSVMKLPQDLDNFFVELESMLALPPGNDSQAQHPPDDPLSRLAHSSLQVPAQSKKTKYRHSMQEYGLHLTSRLSPMTEEDGSESFKAKTIARSATVPTRTKGGLHGLDIGQISFDEIGDGIITQAKDSGIDSAYGSEQQLDEQSTTNSNEQPLSGFKKTWRTVRHALRI